MRQHPVVENSILWRRQREGKKCRKRRKKKKNRYLSEKKGVFVKHI